ncbi:hypothetical protein K7X08_036950 [Anisodus acutangulus]|uniref:Kinesin motor domain-containing protein n=1 Tax=Anisodus acutangulus TaxID=402998 RepID=A0A9Q1L9K1_9SOLA|nr:hypothetical protein K7X08_036950 [Anisodus acutangulus]
MGDEGKMDADQSRTVAVNATPRSTRTTGRVNSNHSESHSNQNIPSTSVTKPPNPASSLASGSRTLASGAARMANYASLYRGIPISGNSSNVVDTVEVPHFDLKENLSFWLEHNVQPETRFTFDHVVCETINQETLFRMVGLSMVENCLSGYNSSIFAYGQVVNPHAYTKFVDGEKPYCLPEKTGSGKTHTMLGEIEELEIRPSPNRGMTPHIFEFLFARISAEEESRRDERLQYSCKCSFLEIYNEQITDLLDPSSTNLNVERGYHERRSISFCSHVIMVLVDVANGRPRHVPYRDSKLTFLLQDSLGGN